MPVAMLVVGATLIGLGHVSDDGLEGAAGLHAQPAAFVIDEGETTTVDAAIETAHLVVNGRLEFTAPGTFAINADIVSVGPTGAIIGYTPERLDVAVGKEFGEDGGDGGDVWIKADRFEVAPGGLVAGGSGAAGQSVLSKTNATAGHGGQGGDVLVFADEVAILGDVLPGRGGDGGTANAIHVGDAAQFAAVGGHGGDSGQVAINGQQRLQPNTHIPASSHSIRFFQFDKSLIQSLFDGLFEGDIEQWLDFSLLACQPTGMPGADNWIGRGGDGGDACADAAGTSGRQGAHGRANYAGCTDGGPGSNGSPAVAGTATAGWGGNGATDGGNGGMGSATANGGSGGAGGIGGSNWMYQCAGGNGGDGASATGGQATGGDGGNGLCGRGGDSGDARAWADEGLGGHGGAGSPRGNQGSPGTAYAGSASGGRGGSGGNAC